VLEIGLEVHHSHLVDLGIGPENAVWASVPLIGVLLVEAYHRIEGSKPRGFPDMRRPVRPEDYSLAEKGQSRLEQEPCLYPTSIGLAREN
jgi:hypothetical protein